MVSEDPRTAPVAPWTSARWVAYFTANDAKETEAPWHLGPSLTLAEKAAIGRSIAEFQLGESSDGTHLVAAAERYARASGDRAYRQAIGLFIGEENRHARELGRLMDLEGIPRKRSSLVDQVFRLLRRYGGIEVAVAVLVSAEIIAQVYYRACYARPARRSCARCAPASCATSASTCASNASGWRSSAATGRGCWSRSTRWRIES